MGRKTRDFVKVTYSTIDSIDNIVETDIVNDNDTFLSEEKLKSLLEKNIDGKPHLILGILIAVNEVVDNILEHSDGGKFKEFDRVVSEAGTVSIEYCKDDSHLIITIWDFGKGVVDTLSKEYHSFSRKEVLVKAFEPNTTRHRKHFPSRGNGLAKLKEFVLKSNGSIFCETNEFQITFSSMYHNGYAEEVLEKIKGTHFEIKVGCLNEINIYPIFDTDIFEDFFNFEENSTVIRIEEHSPLNSHQVGIRIKEIIIENIRNNHKFIRLDFDKVEIFTDSFIQQITTILCKEISFKTFEQKVKFTNLNKKFLLLMVQEKIYIASQQNCII